MEIVFNTNKKLKGFWGIQDAKNTGKNKPNIGSIKKQKVAISETENGIVYFLRFSQHWFLHPRQKENRIIKMLSSAKRGEFTTKCISFPTLEEAKDFAKKIVNVPNPKTGKLADGKQTREEI
tara:strand:- start:12 stop:377 length:366 start_codon:yes stop_codon:yes gene_type:complete